MSNPLLGLTGSVNDRDQAYRDIAQTESLYGMMDRKKQAEMQAQQMEAMAFDEMYKQSDELLEKDRKRINKKILLSQSQLRDQIGEAGGSRKDFFEKGGISALNNIKNSIVRSDENIRYQENKKNLTNIMLAQKDGLGHRLTPQDRQSVEDYHNNPDGATITYTGMMSEVEIPPAANFEFGKEIHPEYVASYAGNMVKILGNYKMMYPDREVPDPQTRDGLDVINKYVRQMGWGGTGSRMMPKDTTTKTGRTTDTRTAAQKDMEDKVTYNNNYRTWTNDLGQPSVDDIIAAEKEGGFIGKRRKGDPENGIPSDKMTTAMAREKSDVIVEYNGTNEKGFEALDLVLWPHVRDAWDDFFDSDVALKDSYNAYGANTMTVAKTILGDESGGLGHKMDGKYVLDYKPKGNVYTAKGVRVGSSDLSDEYQGKYEVLGVKTAWKMEAGNGTDSDSAALMINVMNGKEIDEEATAKIDAGYKGDNSKGTAKAATVIALKNEAGDVFYHEIDVDDDSVSQKLSNIMAEDNDLTETVQLDKTTQERQQAASKMNAQQRVALETAKKETGEIFTGQESDFGFEMEPFYKPNSGGQKNRNKLAETFYLAADYSQRELQDPEQDPKNAYVDKGNVNSLVKGKAFTEEVAGANGMDKKLRDYDKYNNEQLVQSWYEEVQKDLDPESQDYRVNAHIANRWKQFLQNY